MLAKLPEKKRVALEAAQLIRERGHCKHVLHDEQGRVCLMGALNLALYQHAVYQTLPGLELDIAEEMRVQMGLPSANHLLQSIVRWNNAPERTAEEVIEALESYALSV